MEEKILELIKELKNMEETNKKYYAGMNYEPHYNTVEITIRERVPFKIIEKREIHLDFSQAIDKMIEDIRNYPKEAEVTEDE